MPDPDPKEKLPPTATEIAELVKRIDALEGKKTASDAEIAALKGELKKLQDAAGAKPERKRDRWGWPVDA
jgi:predicted nuclease with TOPRIM domain